MEARRRHYGDERRGVRLRPGAAGHRAAAGPGAALPSPPSHVRTHQALVSRPPGELSARSILLAVTSVTLKSCVDCVRLANCTFHYRHPRQGKQRKPAQRIVSNFTNLWRPAGGRPARHPAGGRAQGRGRRPQPSTATVRVSCFRSIPFHHSLCIAQYIVHMRTAAIFMAA